MDIKTLVAVAARSAGAAVLAFSMSQTWATSTSLEMTGLLLDGAGNRITAQPYMIFTSGIYNSATGGTLLLQLGPENVQVSNGSYLQVFGVDDSLFQADAYLQVNLNGFDMTPRLNIFFNGTYYVVNGATSGPTAAPIFQLYAGAAAQAVPEPGAYALLLAGLAVGGVLSPRRRTSTRGALNVA
jgi:hypothetical protein